MSTNIKRYLAVTSQGLLQAMFVARSAYNKIAALLLLPLLFLLQHHIAVFQLCQPAQQAGHPGLGQLWCHSDLAHAE